MATQFDLKAYVKTSTGKIVKSEIITSTCVYKGELYVIWEEKWYDTIASFKEAVVATADKMEDLVDGKNKLSKKRPNRH